MKWTSLLVVTVATILTPNLASAENAQVKLWRLDCGSIVVKNIDLFSDSFQYGGKPRTLAASCYLIQHGDTYMIWDTGLPKGVQNAPQGDAPLAPSFKTTVVDQLKALNVTPDMISLVGISHDHFDHTGQALDFTKATLLIGKGDLERLKLNPSPFAVDPSGVAPWLNGESKVETLEGDKDVFGDGSVTILATPGHTPTSQSLLVRLNKTGPVILSGDTAHFEEQFANDGVPPFNVNRAESLASMDRLEKIAANLKATLIVQHDATHIAKLPTFPQAAE